jgi:Raf kinase inhibitor-like YbhB/YbcL family protein
MKISLKSPAFNNGEMIPKKYTCDGQDISPPLQWDTIPLGTESFALISDDPDAPVGIWVHWVIYNIPPALNSLPEQLPPIEFLPNGAIQGLNDFYRIGYGGPCPPPGRAHRYFFKIYALDCKLNLKNRATSKDLVSAMAGHILAEGQLMGLYQR